MAKADLSTAQCRVSNCCWFTDDMGREAERARNYIQYPVIHHNGKAYEKCVYVCVCVYVYIYIYTHTHIYDEYEYMI